MKIIEIPENINDLRDYSELHKLIKVCQNFINNSNEYIKKVIFTEYVKTYEEWIAILSEKDLITLETLIKTHPSYGNYNFQPTDLQIFRNINKNTFGFFTLKYNPGCTGALSFNGYEFKFNNNGTIIKIHVKYESKPYRRDNVPWTQHIDIWSLNLVTKNFKFVEHK